MPVAQQLPQWAQILSAFLTPVIAITVAVIGYLQWRTNQNKLRLDLFAKRYAIYDEVKQFIGVIIRKAAPDDEDLLKFIRGTQDAQFLFANDKLEYLNLIRSRAGELYVLGFELKELGDPDRQSKIEKKHEHLRWFSEQFEYAAKFFASELRLKH